MNGNTTILNNGKDKIELTLLDKPMEQGLVGMVSSELFVENIAIVVEDNPQTVEYDFACLGYTKAGTAPRVMMKKEFYEDLKKGTQEAKSILFHEIGHYANGDIFINTFNEDDERERLGMTIDWNADDREVTMEKDGNVFIAGLGTLSGTMNGTNITLHNELELVNSRVCAPVRDIAELFGYIVLGNTLEGKVSVYDQKNYLIEKLLRNDLIPVGVYGYSLDEKIYRRQIADVLVGLYEKVNGEIEITEDNPYTDVNSETIVKAYCSGILVGYEDGEFKPLEYVNRSEVIALFQRLLIKSGVSMPTDLSNTEEYTDITKDSDHWAREYVYQMNALGALDNVFEGEIGINDGATIKDVLSICQNCYELVVK